MANKKKIYYKVVTDDRKSAFTIWSDGDLRLKPYILEYPKGKIVQAPNHVGIFVYSSYNAAESFAATGFDLKVLEVYGIGRPMYRKYINSQCRYDAFFRFEQYLKGIFKPNEVLGLPPGFNILVNTSHVNTVWFKAVEVLT